MATSQPTASKRCLRHHRAAVTARVSVVSTAVSPRWVSAPNHRRAAMSACRRSCCAMPSSTRLQVPVRCQPSASSAINAPPASRAQAAAAMLSSITVVALAA